MKNPGFLLVPYLVLTAAAWNLAGCSSTSPPPEEINLQRNRAADFTKFGNQYFDQAQFGQAENFFLLALQNNTAIDNLSGAAASWNSLGKTYLAQGKEAEAEKAFLEAAALGKTLGSTEIQLQGVNNLAELKIRRGEVEQAIKDLEGVLAGKVSLETKEAAVIFHSLGAAYRKKASQSSPEGSKTPYAQALEWFGKAAAVNLKLKLFQELASNQYMTASVHLRLGNLDLAEKTAQEALSNDRKMENSLGIAQDLRLLGEIAWRGGKAEEAAQYHLRSYRVFQALGLPSQEARSLDLLIPAAEKAGQTREAALYKALRKEISP